jgi:hypothetical protein
VGLLRAVEYHENDAARTAYRRAQRLPMEVPRLLIIGCMIVFVSAIVAYIAFRRRSAARRLSGGLARPRTKSAENRAEVATKEKQREAIRVLIEKAGIPAERIQVLTNDDIAEGEPGTGILVTVTIWSSSSRIMLTHVAHVLGAEEFGRVPLYFIDGDEYNEVFDNRRKLSDAEQILVSHGNGEVFWFSNGLLVHRIDIHGKLLVQRIAEFTRGLF